MKKKINENNVRIIKISKEALFEFIYEKMLDDLERFFDVEPTSVTSCFDIDWKNGQFMICTYKSEDEKGNFIKLSKDIDLQKLMQHLPDTTPSMYQNNRYQEYTKEELIELSQKD